MSWLNSILHFTAVYSFFAIPHLPGLQMKMFFQSSKPGLNTSSTLQGRTPSPKHSPFMIQLYQAITLGNTTHLSSLEQSILQESDTILGLKAKVCSQMTNHRALLFDMSSITSYGDIQMAELRMHLSSEKIHDMTFDIYHSKDGGENIFVGSKKLDFSNDRGSPLKVINVTKMIQSSFHQGRLSNSENMADNESIINDQESRCKEMSMDKFVLVVFTMVNASAKPHGYRSLIQTAQSSKYVQTPQARTRRLRKVRNSRLEMANISTQYTEDGRPLCRRVDMIVDFEKFGWGDEIVHPKKFNAFRCEGACPNPLTENFNPTNYAYVMSLVNLHNPDNIGCPSCVPVKMKALSMLIYEGGKVNLQHHEDLVVEECGCH